MSLIKAAVGGALLAARKASHVVVNTAQICLDAPAAISATRVACRGVIEFVVRAGGLKAKESCNGKRRLRQYRPGNYMGECPEGSKWPKHRRVPWSLRQTITKSGDWLCFL